MHEFMQKPKTPRQATPIRPAITGRLRFGQSGKTGLIPRLQHTIGNQAIQRLLQINIEERNAELTSTVLPHFRHDFSQVPVSPPNAGAIQAKLAISKQEDEYEQEADRIAAQVIRMPEPQIMHNACPYSGGCPKCKTKQLTPEHERLQTKRFQAADTEQVPVPPIVHEALRSPAQPLDNVTRSYFEPRFRYDFRDVRIHTNAEATRSAERLNAKAFTIGNRIVFNASRFAPNTSEGRQLLAHELTHVVQQRAGIIQRERIDECRLPYREYITEAVTRAYHDIAAVLRFMRVRPLLQRVSDALWLAFRDDSVETADQVRRNLERVHYAVNHAHYRCHNPGDADYSEDCRSKTYGHAARRAQGPVYICMPQFADLRVHSQSRALIHEITHRYLGLNDRGYFEINQCAETPEKNPGNASGETTYGTAGLPPDQRLNNADSYGCFVHYMTYLPQTPEQARTMPPRGPHGHEEPLPQSLEEQAASYRGENLRIVGNSLTMFPTRIHTRTTIEHDPTFRIVDETLGRGTSGPRLPENSGFQFRWSLTVDNDEYRLESRAGLDTSLFNEHNSEVFVSNAERRRLERTPSRQGTLRCEIRLFQRHGRQFPPPVIVKEIGVTVARERNPFDPSLL